MYFFCILMNLLMCHPFSRERVCAPKDETADQKEEFDRRAAVSVATGLQSPRSLQSNNLETANTDSENGLSKPNYSARSLLKSASISASKCIGMKARKDTEVIKFCYNMSCLSI